MWAYISVEKRLIFVPVSLREEMLDWYHSSLHHPGAERMSLSIWQYLYWHGIETYITNYMSKCATVNENYWGKEIRQASTKYNVGHKSVGDCASGYDWYLDL